MTKLRAEHKRRKHHESQRVVNNITMWGKVSSSICRNVALRSCFEFSAERFTPKQKMKFKD